MADYDLFLSYSSADREAVLEIRDQLKGLGVKTFFDKDNLRYGGSWPKELEDALRSSRGVAVFAGRGEMGRWQRRESDLALVLQEQAGEEDRTYPVFPVFLPGADLRAGFLFLNHGVDLRQGVGDKGGIDRLVAALKAPSEAAERPDLTDICPYRGLEPFRRQDEPFFFGREAFTKRLLETVLVHDLVAVVGPSGSGKSSVVQAGLLPALGRHPEARAWEVVTMRPAERPFRSLGCTLVPLLEPELSEVDRITEGNKLGDALEKGNAELGQVVGRLLDKSTGSTRLLLIVDQFEELFRETPEEQRRPFVDALLQAGDRARVALTLRADFYEQALALSRPLVDKLRSGQELLGALTQEELERVVRRPAERLGLKFQGGLPEVILREVGDELGRLPLLEFCLQELWNQREGRLLTHEGYAAIGRVEGALARRAERAFQGLGPDLAEPAKHLFTERLVRVAKEAEAGKDTKRKVPLAELSPEEKEVVTQFSGQEIRLLVADEHSVEIVHEALIEQWATLREWISANRDRLRQAAQVRDARVIGELVATMVLDDTFLEKPQPFLRAAADRLVVLANDSSPYVSLSESLWRLDYLTVKGKSDETQARARVLGRELRTELQRAVLDRTRNSPPSPSSEWLVLIEPGLARLRCGSGEEVEASFCMGRTPAGSAGDRNDESPEHPVILSPYRMQTKTVTNTEYVRFDPSHGGGRDNLPVVEVSWHLAYAYAAWLGGRLPTEAEWECACRAGTTTRWSFGDEESEIERYAWVVGNLGGQIHPVGWLAPNDWGLYDMHGNVGEWVADRYARYSPELQVDPQGPASGGWGVAGRRVVRGGSFNFPAGHARSALRDAAEPAGRLSFLGFRVVLPAPCRDSAVDPGS